MKMKNLLSARWMQLLLLLCLGLTIQSCEKHAYIFDDYEVSHRFQFDVDSKHYNGYTCMPFPFKLTSYYFPELDQMLLRAYASPTTSKKKESELFQLKLSLKSLKNKMPEIDDCMLYLNYQGEQGSFGNTADYYFDPAINTAVFSMKSYVEEYTGTSLSSVGIAGSFEITLRHHDNPNDIIHLKQGNCRIKANCTSNLPL